MFALRELGLLDPGVLLDQSWYLLPLLAFQIWMLVDAVRRREWVWAVFILFFSFLTAFFYYLLVYRAAPSSTRGFELPGSYDRRRIKELQAQIHHLDKAHHHLELGNIYFQQGNLEKAEAAYRAALERDPQDVDTIAHLGQCLLRRQRAAEARPFLESVARSDPRHDYGHTLMAYAETLAALGEPQAAIAAWQQVLESHSYARARVQLAELYAATQQTQAARRELEEVIADDVHTPRFHRQHDRVWIKKAKSLLAHLPKP